MKTIRYGFVGCGYSAGIHADSLLKIPTAKIVACYDTVKDNAIRLAERCNARVEPSLEALCAREDLDAVLVCTPNYCHTESVLCALENGKNVFCEKPAALNVKETIEMVKRADEVGKYFFIGHCLNFMSGINTVKDLLEKGAIGEILMMDVVHTDWAEPQPKVGWKQLKKYSGGHLYHHMHEVDLICQFMGLPKTVYAMGGNLAHHGEGCGDEDDMVFLSMKMKDGKFATLQIGSAFRLGDYYLKIQGTKGGIKIDIRQAKVILSTPDDVTEFSLYGSPELDEERRNEFIANKKDSGKLFGKPGMKGAQWMSKLFMDEMLAFHRLMQENKIDDNYKNLIDGTAAINCLKVLDAASESIKSSCEISLE
ncbi:MAG: Gfo/Idh/MocA family oxidoreductase [Clostridiaceae bacterium]|nr:Gfo/Idh/MocA family oxidoreductase [Clostridiaceae bacterium]